MTAEKILGNIRDTEVTNNVVEVPFEWFELEKRRILKTAEDGTEVGVAIVDMLRDGDIIGNDADKTYVVKVIPSHLIKIHVTNMKDMGRLGFELGNRHLTLRIEENDVWVPFDAPTFEYLLKLGFDAVETEEKFTDFTVCKAHGHSHDHQHEHHHDHHHNHSHQ